MLLQQFLVRTSVTAVVGGAKLDLPASVEPGDQILLALVGGYNADIEFSAAQSGTPWEAKQIQAVEELI